MSTRILITPEEVRGVASQFRAASENSGAMVQNLSRVMNDMHQNWAGMTSQKFYTDYEQWQKDMNRWAGLLNDINQTLLSIADRFERADTTA